MSIPQLPAVLPGHWATPDGHDKALEYSTMKREQLGFGDKPDLAIANAIFMVGRDDLELIALQIAAKERIRWLSVQLAMAEMRNADLCGRLALADEALMASHGCFPLDRCNEQDRLLNDAARAIREISGDDYERRQRAAANFRGEWLSRRESAK